MTLMDTWNTFSEDDKNNVYYLIGLSDEFLKRDSYILRDKEKEIRRLLESSDSIVREFIKEIIKLQLAPYAPELLTSFEKARVDKVAFIFGLKEPTIKE